MIVTPIRWMGGKATIAPQIVALMPRHGLYFEPFAGGLGVFYAKTRAKVEVINDRHGDLVNLYRVMRNQPADFLRACELMPFARDEYRRGFYIDPGLPALERAALFYLYLRSCFAGGAGSAGVSGFAIESAEADTSRAAQYQTALNTLPEACERLRGVTIENRCAFELIEGYGRSSNALIYADPPYMKGGERRAAGKNYKFEFAEGDHARLADLLRACRAKVMISYYDDPRLRELYAGWTFCALNQYRSQKRGVHRPAEVVICNFQPTPTLFDEVKA